MGSYNVSCGISGISIRCGMRTKLILLLPHRYNSIIHGQKPGMVVLEPTISHVSNEGAFAYYVPFCLPIEGEYDDYGSLKNIKKDTNVETLEKFFGITIDNILSIVSVDREIYDIYAGIMEPYGIIPELLQWNGNNKFKFSKENFIKLGFEIVEEKGNFITFTHKAIPQITIDPTPLPNGRLDAVLMKKLEKVKKENEKKPKEAKFAVVFNTKTKDIEVRGSKIEEKKFEAKEYDQVKDFCEFFQNETSYEKPDFFSSKKVSGYLLNIKDEDQNKVRLLKSMSGMFMHADIYDELVKFNRYGKSSECDGGSFFSGASLSPDNLEKLGFVFSHKEEKFDRYKWIYKFPGVENFVLCSDKTWAHISKPGKEECVKESHTYDIQGLFRDWKKFTKVELKGEEEYKKLSKYEELYSNIKKKAQSEHEFLNGGKEKIEEELKKCQELPEDERQERVMTLLKSLTKMEMAEEDDDFGYDDRSTGLFHDWQYFKKLYFSFIFEERKDLKEDIMNFCHFYWSFYGNNKIFMPSTCGPQFGDYHVTLALAKKTMEIAAEVLKGYGEEE